MNVAEPLQSFLRANNCHGVATFIISGLVRKHLKGAYCVTSNECYVTVLNSGITCILERDIEVEQAAL